jgi:hypothetical protein
MQVKKLECVTFSAYQAPHERGKSKWEVRRSFSKIKREGR